MKLKLTRPICFFDLETTGVNVTHDRIVEIAILKLHPDGTKEDKVWRVNPECPIPAEASAVHGIYDADVTNEPNFKALSKTIHHFIKNSEGIWKTVVFRDSNEQLLGFLSSVNHPGCRMIGPGVARAENIITALLATQLDFFRGFSPVFLLPTDATQAIKTVYSWGARNCEIHFAQCLGQRQVPKGVIMPSFMPETG